MVAYAEQDIAEQFGMVVEPHDADCKTHEIGGKVLEADDKALEPDGKVPEAAKALELALKFLELFDLVFVVNSYWAIDQK